MRAPAKLNLFLHVIGRRGDGYHLLDSWAGFAGAHDTLSAVPAAELALAVDGPFAACLGEANNLVLRAAQALAAEAGIKTHAALRLTKNLPVASGLGGGSSDAAAALLLLNRLWGLDWALERLQAVGKTLGADIPVCLARKSMRMGGIGEGLQPAPALPEGGVLLVNPGLPLTTGPVFASLAESCAYSEAAPELPASDSMAALADWLHAHTRNDLAPHAAQLLPVIDEVLAAIAGQGGCLLARMSGSGPTCFGLFGDKSEAVQAASATSAAHPGWWVWHGGWHRNEKGEEHVQRP